MLVDDFAEPADFVGPKKRRRTAAKMELDRLALPFSLGAIFATSRPSAST